MAPLTVCGIIVCSNVFASLRVVVGFMLVGLVGNSDVVIAWEFALLWVFGVSGILAVGLFIFGAIAMPGLKLKELDVIMTLICVFAVISLGAGLGGKWVHDSSVPHHPVKSYTVKVECGDGGGCERLAEMLTR